MDIMKRSKMRSNGISLMAVILISKVIGMARDVVLANYFGTTRISDAFLIALTIPTTLFAVIGHGLSTAYIPMYNKVRVEDGEQKAMGFSNNLLNISLLLCGIIAAVLVVFPKPVVRIFAAGFDEATANIAIRLIRISAASIFLMCIVNICGGYLQANKNFLAPAAISLPRNFAIVVSIVLAASLGTDLLAWGLLAAYVLEFLFLLPFLLRKGYRFQPGINLKDENLKETLYVVAPIVVGVCVGQVNKIVDRSMASTIIEGGISALTYASIINNAIQEVLVTGIITILFASCAELVARQEYGKVKAKLSGTIQIMLFLILPACIGVMVLAEPIVKLVLCRGEFDDRSLKMTVASLRCYTVGLLFLAVRDTLVKVFYAFKETKITTKVSITAILLNIVLNIALGKWIGLNGLALATSFSAVFSCVTLFVLLRKRIGDFGSSEIVQVFVKSLAGSLVIGWFAHTAYTSLLRITTELAALFATVFACAIGYFLLEYILRNRVYTNFRKEKA